MKSNKRFTGNIFKIKQKMLWKQLNCFIVFFGLVLCAFSQNTIVNPGSAWSTLAYGLERYNIPCCYSTSYLYFEGDSLVNDISYKKVLSCKDILHQDIKYEGLMREQDKKTYFIPALSETEYIMYDFSLEEGMNFEYLDFETEISQNISVLNSDSVLINGLLKKRIEFSNGSIWIEKIGSLNGIMYPLGYLGDGGDRSLLCCYDAEELIYQNPEYEACYYNDVSVPVIKNVNLRIYPNPVYDKLYISSPEEYISQVEIFNVSGQLIYSQNHAKSIDFGSFPNGIYVLKIYAMNRGLTVFKVIKT